MTETETDTETDSERDSERDRDGELHSHTYSRTLSLPQILRRSGRLPRRARRLPRDSRSRAHLRSLFLSRALSLVRVCMRVPILAQSVRSALSWVDALDTFAGSPVYQQASMSARSCTSLPPLKSDSRASPAPPNEVSHHLFQVLLPTALPYSQRRLRCPTSHHRSQPAENSLSSTLFL